MIRGIRAGVVELVGKRQGPDIRRQEQERVEPVRQGVAAREARQTDIPLDPCAAHARDPSGQTEQKGAGAGAGFQDAIAWPGGHRRREQNRLQPAAETVGRLVITNPPAEQMTRRVKHGEA